MDPKLISCIILSSDSHINKGNSVFHCIFSLLQQNYKNIEIILIENSHKKNKKMINLLQKKVRSWNRLRQYPVDFKIVDNPHHLPYGKARTRGASKAKGEIFVFTEDDTILVTKNAFSQIAELSKQFDCGFGAQRLWTKDKKFQKSSKSLLDEPPTSTYFKSLLKISGNPPSNVRGSRDVRLQRRSLIANFGFIKRKIFQDVGGFIAFPGRGFDDDHMMFKLYKGGYKHTLLDTIQVVHINHPQRTNCVHNLPYYFAELVKSGYYWFETIQLFLCNTNHDQILIPLKNVHYDERIEKAFNEYLAILPLDLRDQNVKFYNSWKANNQLSILDFSQ